MSNLGLIYEKAFKSLDHVLQSVLKDFNRSYILGGFGIAHLHGIDPTDIDLFIPHEHFDEVTERLSCFPHTKFREYDIVDSYHSATLIVDTIKVDIVFFRCNFDPKTHVDFHCRMVQVNSKSFIFPTDFCRKDIFNRILRYNVDYKPLKQISETALCVLTCTKSVTIEITAEQCTMLSTLLENSSKYKLRGWKISL